MKEKEQSSVDITTVDYRVIQRNCLGSYMCRKSQGNREHNSRSFNRS